MNTYQQAKQALKQTADNANFSYTDKPLIRQLINEDAYYIGMDYKLTENQKNMLANYACKLHPK